MEQAHRAVWDALSAEERDGHLEQAQEEARENNCELRKLGYDSSADDWMGKVEIEARAVEIAWADSDEGKAENAARIQERMDADEIRRRADLARVREAWDRGMFAYYHYPDWHEEPLSNYSGLEHLLAYRVTKEQVEEARRLGL